MTDAPSTLDVLIAIRPHADGYEAQTTPTPHGGIFGAFGFALLVGGPGLVLLIGGLRGRARDA